MSQIKETGLGKFYRVWVPKITSVGAALVVIGALFKIMHWEGAATMLTVGLLTEGFLFLLGTFQPAPPIEQHYDWALVYPELAADSAAVKAVAPKSSNKNAAALAKVDDMLANADLSADAFKNFGSGIKKLNSSVDQMKDISATAAASNDYTRSLQTATKSMSDLNNAYASTVSAMGQMAGTAKDAKEYHAQIQVITKNLGALNAVYEMELKDANSHLKAMNKFYGNLTTAMESMADASRESKVFKDQMSSLTTNLTQLNKVYGNMLTAMKG